MKKHFLAVLRKLSERLEEMSFGGGSSQRIETECEPCAPLRWLNHQKIFPRFYWKNRDSSFEIAGLGEADALLSTVYPSEDWISVLKSRLNNSFENHHYYGVMSPYKRGSCVDPWDNFSSIHFVLPAVELFRSRDKTFMACNIFSLNERDFQQKKALLRSFLTDLVWEEKNSSSLDLRSRQESLFIQTREDLPSVDIWKQKVESILEEIALKNISKCVMTRLTKLVLSNALCAGEFFENLSAKLPDTYHFFYERDTKNAFMSLTPERLYDRKHRELRGDILAGTGPRGVSEVQDVFFEKKLKESSKERQEHQFVIEHCLEKLKPLAEKIRFENTFSVQKLFNVQHLFSDLVAQLKEGVGDWDLLQSLYPSAAITGYPQKTVFATIVQRESFFRGWFTGLIGVISSDAVDRTEFVVSIRCALLRDCELCLFAGAGIVQGSLPLLEWEELEQKMSPFLKELSGEN